jgi:hypothetical protein
MRKTHGILGGIVLLALATGFVTPAFAASLAGDAATGSSCFTETPNRGIQNTCNTPQYLEYHPAVNAGGETVYVTGTGFQCAEFGFDEFGNGTGATAWPWPGVAANGAVERIAVGGATVASYGQLTVTCLVQPQGHINVINY